jgi:D-sedoheptulose 7-phosphate isomerase
MQITQNWITEYLAAQHRAVEALDPAAIAALVDTLRVAHREGKQVLVCGNGGSAANASHFVTDLGKSASDKLAKRFRTIALNDCVSWITAIGNDYAYEDIFLRQLENYGQRGDVLITISVSGNSPNVVKALEWARQNGLRTIALVGAKRGRAADLADQVLAVADTHYGRVEDVQMHILHMMCYAFVENPQIATLD